MNLLKDTCREKEVDGNTGGCIQVDGYQEAFHIVHFTCGYG